VTTQVSFDSLVAWKDVYTDISGSLATIMSMVAGSAETMRIFENLDCCAKEILVGAWMIAASHVIVLESNAGMYIRSRGRLRVYLITGREKGRPLRVHSRMLVQTGIMQDKSAKSPSLCEHRSRSQPSSSLYGPL
jgi:hypothetical protein